MVDEFAVGHPPFHGEHAADKECGVGNDMEQSEQLPASAEILVEDLDHNAKRKDGR